MTRWVRIAGYALIIMVLLIAAGITATIGWRPFVGPAARATTDRRFESTPARLERGKYLADGLTGCLGCHSEPDWSRAALPVEGREGGGRSFAAEGIPWLTAPNITSHAQAGIGGWTDDEVARAIREGISRDGRALFPMMPYQALHRLSDEDLAAIVVYLRTLKPIATTPPPSQIPFPVNRIINTLPEPVTGPVAAPDRSNTLAYGEYLVRMADCAGCHTPRGDRGPIESLPLSGGNVFITPDQQVASSNITPDASGIPYYTEDVFLQMMRTGRVIERKISDAMPWAFYGRLTDDDLKAMFAYLKTVTAVRHRIDNTQPAAECAVCGLTHPGGALNQR